MALTTAAFSKKISQLLVNAEACESIAVQPCCSCDPDPALRLHAIAGWRAVAKRLAAASEPDYEAAARRVRLVRPAGTVQPEDAVFVRVFVVGQ